MELRAGYKQTEVGAIPEDWEVAPFEAVFRKLGAKAHQIQTPEYLSVGTFPVVDQGQKPVVGFTERAEKVFRSPVGGVIIFGDHTCIVKYVNFDFVVGADGTQILATKGGHLTRFHAYALEYQGVEATGYNRHFKFLKERPFFCPPSEEQRAIAGALSDADALIASLDALIAKKRDLKQAAMQQLLTGKTRLPGFKGEWQPLAFAAIFRKVNAKLFQIQTSDYRETGLYPVIDQGQDQIVGFTDRADKLLECPEGGLIVFGDHTRIVKFADFDFIVGADGTQVLSVSGGNSAKFFYYSLLNRELPNTGYNRHFKFLKAMSFAVPESSEQVAIAAILSDIDSDLVALEKERDKARALKQGMMQELLTGRIRLV